jgi:hypothetical protein
MHLAIYITVEKFIYNLMCEAIFPILNTKDRTNKCYGMLYSIITFTLKISLFIPDKIFHFSVLCIAFQTPSVNFFVHNA